MFLHPSADIDVGPPRGDPKISSLLAIRTAEKALWDKWVKFYLPSISAKQVLGEIHTDSLMPGDKVLLREGSNPLVDTWTHAVIKEVFPSPDGIIRSVVVTVNGTDLVRDVTRISVLDGPVLRRRKQLTATSRGVSGFPEPSTAPDAAEESAPSTDQGTVRGTESTDSKSVPEALDEPTKLVLGEVQRTPPSETPDSDESTEPASSSRVRTRSYIRAAQAADELTLRQSLAE
jgi:hypothetical protein